MIQDIFFWGTERFKQNFKRLLSEKKTAGMMPYLNGFSQLPV